MNGQDIDTFWDLYYQIKKEIKNKNKNLYERWKAGGFLVDSNIISDYPTIEKVIEEIGEFDDEN